VVIGAQWGDEGKGELSIVAARRYRRARFQGSHNAGHTLVFSNQTYKLVAAVWRGAARQIVRHRQWRRRRSLGADPEIERLEARGVSISAHNLRVAENATLILPLHRRLDQMHEAPPAGRSAPPAAASVQRTRTRWAAAHRI
jgi:adenylosuccinate synthase